MPEKWPSLSDLVESGFQPSSRSASHFHPDRYSGETSYIPTEYVIRYTTRSMEAAAPNTRANVVAALPTVILATLSTGIARRRRDPRLIDLTDDGVVRDCRALQHENGPVCQPGLYRRRFPPGNDDGG